MSSSVLSEAEEIMAKYSAMKPLLSRPSSLGAIPRFPSMYHRGTSDGDDSDRDREPRVTALRVPVPQSQHTSLSSAATETPPSFRIINRTASIPQGAAPGRVGFTDPHSVSSVSPARDVISPRRSVRVVVQRPSHTTASSTMQALAGGAPPPVSEQALDELKRSYSNHVGFFSEVAREERVETLKLHRDNTRLREELLQSDMIKDEIQQETEEKVLNTKEECTRQVLNLRKSLLLCEQTAGSLRTENEALYHRATDTDILREELELQHVKYSDLQQKMTILAQQNSALQRALKQKESDCTGDLDVYVKQLDVVQKQNAAMKKEMEIMTINAKQQQSLEKEIDRLHRKNAELQTSIHNLDKEAATLQQRHDIALQEKDDDCAREILNYRRQIAAQEKQVESLQTQLEAHIRRQRPSALQDQVVELAKKIETLSTVLVEQERAKDEITVIAQELQRDLETEKQASKEAHDRYRRAMEELTCERSAHRQARQELDELTASLSRAVADAHHQLP